MRRLLAPLLPLLLILACLAAFLPGLDGPFLHDDYANIPQVRVGPATLDAALDVAVRNESGLLRRPLSNLSFAANYWTGGLDPWGYKLTNLVIHGLCGWLVFLLALEVLALLRVESTPAGRRGVALGAAALWLLHPLQVSTVLYVVQRMAQLSALFTFAALWCLARWLNSGDFSWRRAGLAASGYVAFTTLALASKENGALVPLLGAVLIFLWWARRPPEPLAAPALRAFLWAGVLAPLLAGAAILALFPDFVLGGYVARAFGPGERLLTQATVLWFYLRLFFVPYLPWMGLYLDDYPVHGPADITAWLAVAAWGIAVGVALWQRKQRPVLAFTVLWFLAAHALESTLLPLEMVYEHRNYLALFGPALGVSVAAAWLARRAAFIPRPAWAIPLLALFGLTLHRAHTWSSADLFTVTEYRHHPDSFRALLGEASRRISIGAPGADMLTERIRQLRKGQTWTLLLDAARQCTRPGHPVDWAAIAADMRAKPDDERAADYLRFMTAEYSTGRCDGLQADQVGKLLELGYLKARIAGDGLLAERYGMYRAYVARRQGNEKVAAAWYWRGATANPRGIEALFDLAYMELNAGRTEDAAAVVSELERRAVAHGLPIGYRIAEIKQFIAIERRARAKAIAPR